ncbi:MAG: Fic family protein, partial [Paracoccaceae bacterium]
MIDPFPQLISPASALTAGNGHDGLRSISRGLSDPGEYKQLMDQADSPRHEDRDGQGNLLQTALETCSVWLLQVTLDQITFPKKLFDLSGLDKRHRRLVEDTNEDKRALELMSAVLQHGSLMQGDARNTLSKLTK